MKIRSRNASFANPSWIPRACGYWRSRRIGSIFEGDVDSTAPSCARNLLPSLGRFLMLQRRNRWKKWLKWLFCAASQRLSKAYSGGFVGEVSAAETSYFVSSCCLQRSSDTSLHLSSQFKQCKWCLSWPCPARASNELGSSSWVSSWREVFCSLLDLMMLCSRDPVFQKESPRNEIKGVVWFLVLIGRKEKWQLELGEERGQKSLKKFARKWICEGIALAELRRTLNTSTRKGRKADGPYCAPRGLFPIFRLFPLRSVFELGLRSSGLSYPWVRRVIFFHTRKVEKLYF